MSNARLDEIAFLKAEISQLTNWRDGAVSGLRANHDSWLHAEAALAQEQKERQVIKNALDIYVAHRLLVHL